MDDSETEKLEEILESGITIENFQRETQRIIGNLQSRMWDLGTFRYYYLCYMLLRFSFISLSDLARLSGTTKQALTAVLERFENKHGHLLTRSSIPKVDIDDLV